MNIPGDQNFLFLIFCFATFFMFIIVKEMIPTSKSLIFYELFQRSPKHALMTTIILLIFLACIIETVYLFTKLS